MADNQSLELKRIAGALPSSGLTTGAIYFSDTDHTIGVASSASSMVKYYGGNVKGASFAGNILTISLFDGDDLVLDFTDTASASGTNAILKQIRTDIGTSADVANEAGSLYARVAALKAAAHTHDNKTVLDGITAEKVSSWDAVAGAKDGYDTHVADTVKHITAEERTAWNAKQDALSEGQLAAIDAVADKADATVVEALEKYVKGDSKDGNGGLEKRIADLEGADVQDALTDEQLAAVNSGITADKVGDYDEHIADEDIHITADERTAWNAKQDALSDEDKARIAAVDSKANTADLGTAAAKDVFEGAIADSTSDDLVTAAQVKAYAAGVVGAMHFRGAVASTDAITDPASGDICLVGTAEYVYNGSAWVLFGDEGAYEVKGTAQGIVDELGGEASSTAGADVVVTVKSSKGEVSEVSVDSSVLANRVKALEDADAADITADQIDAWDAVAAKKSDYDAHIAATDVHVTTADKEEWSGKQDALDNADVLKSITAEQVEAWDEVLDHNHDDAYDVKGAAAAVSGYGESETTKTVKEVATEVASLGLTGTIAESTDANENKLVSAAQVKEFVGSNTTLVWKEWPSA